MTALYIILGIFAFFFFFSHIPITVDIKTKDELTVKLKVLFFPITLTPKKKKPVKLSDYRIKKFRKKRRKEYKKYLYDKLMSEAREKKKAEQKEKIKAEQPEENKKSLKDKANDALDLIKYVAVRGIKRFGKHLRISVYHLRITVGGKEPDKTAITYGYVCQSVSYLSELFKSHLNMKYPRKTENRIYVGVDFLSGKTDIDAHISFRIKVWHVFSTGLSALIGYITMPKRTVIDQIKK